MSILCKCGLHKWSEWELWTVQVVTYAPSQYKRFCERCKKRQFGKVESKIVPQRY